MRIKMGVWEPGKADPSRYDRASSLEEFVENLRKLNPGDEVKLFLPQDLTGQYLDPVTVTMPASLQADVVSRHAFDVDSHFDLDSTAPITATVRRPAFEIASLDFTVATSTPTLYQELYDAVTDIVAIGNWLTPEQIAIIDENVLRIVRKHDRD